MTLLRLALFSLSFALSAASPDLEQVLALVAAQQKAIESMQSRLDAEFTAQRRVIEEQKSLIEEQRRIIAALRPAPAPVHAAAFVPRPEPVPTGNAAPKWFEKFSFRGYTQIRHNRLLGGPSFLPCESCDRNAGPNTNLSMRRARFILAGDVTSRIYLYFQPDFASTNGTFHFGQIRDLYFDIALNSSKSWRVRTGQSKVPFGFDNLQSSQNRIALDRSDAINSAIPNERDFGTYLMWAPSRIRARLAELSASGLKGYKGSGDYGVLALGVMNGQTANRPEANNDLHYVARLAYPWRLRSGQFVEAGLQAYTGRYTVSSDQRSTATAGRPDFNYADQRIAGTFVYYPQPFGIQAEYNFGRGPQYDAASRSIRTNSLHGGYLQATYRRSVLPGLVLFPFARAQYYDGGKKIELDARRHLVRELELGVEFHHYNFLELTGAYVRSHRDYEDGRTPFGRIRGNLFRLQLQVNY
jgi:hypothetical protein